MKNEMERGIKFEDLQEWYETKTVEFASSVGKLNKSLSCNLKGTFIVKHNNAIVWQGLQPFTAVEEYNKIV